MILAVVGLFVLSSAALGRSPIGMGGECLVNNNYPSDVYQWCRLISTHAQNNRLDPNLVAALIYQESGGNPFAYSTDGAIGLMQVMPRDGRAVQFMCPNGPCFEDRPTISELQDPTFNVAYGTQLLRSLIDEHRGDVREALKAYGPIDTGYAYADNVLAIFERYR